MTCQNLRRQIFIYIFVFIRLQAFLIGVYFSLPLISSTSTCTPASYPGSPTQIPNSDNSLANAIKRIRSRFFLGKFRLHVQSPCMLHSRRYSFTWFSVGDPCQLCRGWMLTVEPLKIRYDCSVAILNNTTSQMLQQRQSSSLDWLASMWMGRGPLQTCHGISWVSDIMSWCPARHTGTAFETTRPAPPQMYRNISFNLSHMISYHWFLFLFWARIFDFSWKVHAARASVAADNLKWYSKQ